MSLWFAAVLGLVQGLTEFLPVSSTAHLRITPALLGQPDPGAAYSAVIQLGTLVAVIAYFARDLFIDIPRALLRDRGSPAGRLPLYLVLGTIPIGIAGLALKDYVKGDFRSLYVVASALAVVAIVMYVADRYASRSRDMDTVTWVDAMIVGCAQVCALVPGVSRSGATIAAALFVGLNRTASARFSFLLGIPAIGAAGVFELRDAIHDLGADAWGPLVVGTFTAAVSGYLSIAWLLRFLTRRGFTPFVIYRMLLGAIILSLVTAGTIQAL